MKRIVIVVVCLGVLVGVTGCKQVTMRERAEQKYICESAEATYTETFSTYGEYMSGNCDLSTYPEK